MLFDLVSIGTAASRLMVSTELFRQAATKAGIEPTARLNSVDHYDVGDLAAIGEAVRNIQAGLTADRLTR